MDCRLCPHQIQLPAYALVLWLMLSCNPIHADNLPKIQATSVSNQLVIAQSLQSLLSDRYFSLNTLHPLEHWPTLNSIYHSRQHRLLWLNHNHDQLSAAGQELLDQLIETSADQLLEYPYHSRDIEHQLSRPIRGPKAAAALDILLTDALISYAEDVLSESLQAVHDTPDPISMASLLTALKSNTPHTDNSSLLAIVADLAPKHPTYKRMRQALKRYQAWSPHWQPLAEGPKILLWQSHPQVAALRQLLIAYGDHPSEYTLTTQVDGVDVNAEQLFDSQLEDSLRQFQRRHGITADGILGKESRAELNIPPAQRIRQIALNMKRWRELPRDLGERYIWVNLTDYQLDLINNDEPELSMKVIIGKQKRQTPTSQVVVGSIVLNPHWNVPNKIATEDILPLIKLDPNYLHNHNMVLLEGWSNPTVLDPKDIDWETMTPETFTYRIQQHPGNDNALGRVKFVTSSDRAIYLHDTSARHLFKRQTRTISSGCVRIEKPLALARALLKNKEDWDDERLQNSLDEGSTQHISLRESVPTYLSYMTAWVDRDHLLHFRKDIYQQDFEISHEAQIAYSASRP